MATLVDKILACMLRFLCCDHAMSFERFHRKFPRLQEWLENPEADKSVLVHIFPTYPHTMTVDGWNRFSAYMRREEGAEYRRFFQHCPKYAKLCLEGCKRCYLKAEGTGAEKCVVDMMYVLAGCKDAEERMKMKRDYPENYEAYLLRHARKRKRLVDDVDSFLAEDDESQGST